MISCGACGSIASDAVVVESDVGPLRPGNHFVQAGHARLKRLVGKTVCQVLKAGNPVAGSPPD